MYVAAENIYSHAYISHNLYLRVYIHYTRISITKLKDVGSPPLSGCAFKDSFLYALVIRLLDSLTIEIHTIIELSNQIEQSEQLK